jgi:ferredoxin
MKPITLTTRIVGEQTRFDQRDSIFPRTAAGLEKDRRVRRWYDVPTPDPIYGALMGIPRSDNCLTYHLVSAVDGPLNPKRAPAGDPARMTWKIKGIARFLGADRVGVCRLNQTYVASHRWDEYMAGSGQPARPIRLGHRFAVSLVFRRDYDLVKAGHSYIDGAEGTLVYNRAAVTACQLAAYIRELGYPARAHHEREEQVLQVPIAVEAGLGELGRLGMLLTPDWGPRVRISTVTTDLPLVPDEPVDIGVQTVCSLCGKCAQNCPSGAIPREGQVVVRGVRKWAIDPRKCLGFWGSCKKKWDDCSLCIAVCPYNRPDTWLNRAHHRPFFFNALRRPSLARLLLGLDDLLRGKRPRWKVRWLDYSSS